MKKLLSLVFVGVVAATAQASYLMWQVDAADVGDFSANAVRIAYSTDDGKTAEGYLTLQEVGDAGLESFGQVATLNGSDGVGTPMLYADVTSYTSDAYSFFIELINYNSASEPPTIQTVAVSQSETYANLTDKGFTSDSMIPTVPTAVWHGGTYSVPEPTSAMLVMFGVGLLALKRKRV